MWFIAPSSNEIRWLGIASLLVSSGRKSLGRYLAAEICKGLGLFSSASDSRVM